MLNILQKGLIKCSGANEEILEKCPTEKNKYAAFGASVLFTSLLAGVSMAYALSTLFASPVVFITLGGVWSSFIFNVDRILMITTKKKS